MQKSLIKNSFFNMIYTIANILFPFLTSIYVSRILLPVGVGRVASAQNIVSYFVTAAALGLPTYGIREFAKVRDTQRKKNQLFTELFLLNIISTSLAVVGFLVLLFANSGFHGEWTLYLACGLAIVFNFLNIDWMYQGLEEYGFITGRSLAVKILSFLMLLILVKDKEDYTVYALLSSLAIGGNYLFNVAHAHKYVKLSFSGIELKRHIKPVLIIACIVFFSSIYHKIDISMLNMLASDEAVGYYSYAQKTVNIILTMSNAVTAALLPRLSYYYDNDKKRFSELLKKGFQVLCTMTFPFCMGLFLVAPQAVQLLYGEAFLPTVFTIRLMCPLIIIKGFGDLFCYQLVYSTNSEKVILPASALASVINVIVNAVLIPSLLQNGAVIASVFSELATNAFQFLCMKKKVGFKIDLIAVVKAVFATSLMAICVLALQLLKIPNPVGLILEVGCGGLVYVIVNLMMKNALMYEILRKIRARLLHKDASK